MTALAEEPELNTLPTLAAEVYHVHAMELLFAGRTNAADGELDRAIFAAEQTGYDRLRAHLYLAKSDVCSQRGNRTEALGFTNMAKAVLARLGTDSGTVRWLRAEASRYACDYLGQLGDFDGAPTMSAAIQKYDAADVFSRRAIAASLGSLANIENSAGNPSAAHEAIEGALQIATELWPDGDSRAFDEILEVQASIFDEAGQAAKARDTFARLLRHMESTRTANDPDMAWVRSVYAKVLSGSWRLENAHLEHTRALRVLEASPDKNGLLLISTLEDLAHIHMHEHHAEKAVPVLERALALVESIEGKDSSNFASLRQDLAKARDKEPHQGR